MELNIQLFGGRGATSGNKINFNSIKVGDKFQQTINGTTYNIEVTRKNTNNYTIQAMSMIENGKETRLFGLNWITTLVEKRTQSTPRGYVSIEEIRKRKK